LTFLVRYQQTGPILQQRRQVLDVAYQLHPERFVRQAPKQPAVPTEAWINKPLNLEIKPQQIPGSCVSNLLTRANMRRCPHGLHSLVMVLIEFTMIVVDAADLPASEVSLSVGDSVPMTLTSSPR
jgi:hypothetical protein